MVVPAANWGGRGGHRLNGGNREETTGDTRPRGPAAMGIGAVLSLLRGQITTGLGPPLNTGLGEGLGVLGRTARPPGWCEWP